VGIAGVDHKRRASIAPAGEDVFNFQPGTEQPGGGQVLGVHGQGKIEYQHQGIISLANGLGLALEARPRQRKDRKEPGQGEEGKTALATRTLEAFDKVGRKHRVQELVPAPLLTVFPQQQCPKPS
jgi:hypothetical protein